MRVRTRTAYTYLSLALSSLLFGCGGGGGDTPSKPTPVPVPPPPANEAPQIQVDAVTTAQPGDSVTMDASASSDDVAITSYLWEQVSGPQITISNPAASAITFTLPDAAGEDIAVRLTLTDEEGESSAKTFEIAVNGRPQISVDFPLANSRFFGEKIQVRGQVYDDRDLVGTRVTVSIDEASYLAAIDSRGQWRIEVPVDASKRNHVITASVRDTGGVEASSSPFDIELLPTLPWAHIVADKTRPGIMYAVTNYGEVYRLDSANGKREALHSPGDTAFEYGQFAELHFDSTNDRILALTYGSETLVYAFELENKHFVELIARPDEFGEPLGWTSDFAVSNDNSRIYINSSTDQLFTINLENQDITPFAVNELSDDAGNFGTESLVYGPEGTVYLLDWGTGSLAQLNVETGERTVLASEAATGTSVEHSLGLTYAPELNSLFTHSFSGSIHQFNLLTRTSQEIEINDPGNWNHNFMDLEWDVHTQRILLSGSDTTPTIDSPVVVAVELDGTIDMLISDNFGTDVTVLGSIYYISDSKKILALGEDSSGGHFLSIDPLTHQVERLCEDANPTYPDWLTYNGGSKVYFTTGDPKQIHSCDIVTGVKNNIEVPDINGEPLRFYDLALNPAGTSLYIIHEPLSAEPVLVEIDVETGELREIVSNSFISTNMQLAAEDDSVLMANDGSTTTMYIARVDIQTGETEVVTDNLAFEGEFIHDVLDMKPDPHSNKIFVAQYSGITAVDKSTGSKSVVFQNRYPYNATGNGEKLFPSSITKTTEDGVFFTFDLRMNGIFAVDSTTGDRVLVYK